MTWLTIILILKFWSNPFHFYQLFSVIILLIFLIFIELNQLLQLELNSIVDSSEKRFKQEYPPTIFDRHQKFHIALLVICTYWESLAQMSLPHLFSPFGSIECTFLYFIVARSISLIIISFILRCLYKCPSVAE